VLYDLGGGTNIGVTTARAFRTPNYVELYSQGPHLAAYSFEVGNPDLDLERGTGADVFLRVDTDLIHLDVAGFYNRINNYVFPRNTGEISRLQLPIYQFASEAATMIGAEGDVRLNLHSSVRLSGSVSYVRGTITETDEPLPLIPPLSGGVNVRYQNEGFFVGGGFTGATEQSRVGEFEEPTDGYVLFNASAGVQWFKFGWLHSITIRADNLTDVEYRNHLSRVKSVMPEAGRSVTLVYRVDF
jgi:iron complex outermembrane receptor protein